MKGKGITGSFRNSRTICLIFIEKEVETKRGTVAKQWGSVTLDESPHHLTLSLEQLGEGRSREVGFH